MDGIKRFTTEYVIPEDRIRLSLESNDGQMRVLWLTAGCTSPQSGEEPPSPFSVMTVGAPVPRQ